MILDFGVEWLSFFHLSHLLFYNNLIWKNSGFKLLNNHLKQVFLSAVNLLYSSFLVGVRATLTWHKRLKIALDTARGLAFLHGVEKPIIYRDFKTSNILLDEVGQPLP